jgi:hypothetical protein
MCLMVARQCDGAAAAVSYGATVSDTVLQYVYEIHEILPLIMQRNESAASLQINRRAARDLSML